ncbi:MAG: 50S ribosomal protein L6 [Mariprofundaceae bacterium]|nr:50S ribosomal protein L6 [Mariprofundaceae bacterium]
MSRIGKQPIDIPAGVAVTIEANQIIVKGAKGSMASPLFPTVSVSQEGTVLKVSCSDVKSKKNNALFGLVRSLIANNIVGVSQGFSKILELRGVGYRAQLQGRKLVLALGFSHPIEYILPDGVDANVEQTKITISGYDKQQVGQVAAEVRAFRPPEPYKGKGVRYMNERVIMKEGKRA